MLEIDTLFRSYKNILKRFMYKATYYCCINVYANELRQKDGYNSLTTINLIIKSIITNTYICGRLVCHFLNLGVFTQSFEFAQPQLALKITMI